MKEDLTQSSYSSALLTDDYTICGVKMKPFCLGHIVILEALQNPLIDSDVKDVAVDDGLCQFFLALLICALTYEEGVQLLNDSKLFSEISAQFCDNLQKNMDEDENWNIHSKLNLFKNYMSSYLNSMPYYNETQKQNTDAPSGNDWKTSIFIVFKKLGYSESEILNMNIRKLFIEWAGYAESEGVVKICNKHEANQLKQFQLNKG